MRHDPNPIMTLKRRMTQTTYPNDKWQKYSSTWTKRVRQVRANAMATSPLPPHHLSLLLHCHASPYVHAEPLKTVIHRSTRTGHGSGHEAYFALSMHELGDFRKNKTSIKSWSAIRGKRKVTHPRRCLGYKHAGLLENKQSWIIHKNAAIAVGMSATRRVCSQADSYGKQRSKDFAASATCPATPCGLRSKCLGNTY